MPVFTLKKYETPEKSSVTQPVSDSPQQQADNASQELVEVQIEASDTVAGIVARALYKAIPNQPELEAIRQDNKAATQVLSTEDINSNPVGALDMVRGKANVVIINTGFKTPQEEWFLTSMESLGVNLYYSVESFLKSNNLKA